MKTITVVGAGMMGSAMTYPASRNGHEVRLVGTCLDEEIIRQAIKTGYHKTLKRNLPRGVKSYQIEDLPKALEGAHVLVSGVSSFGVDWFLENVLPLVPDSVPLLLVTKGMISTTGANFISFPEYYQEKLAHRNLSINAIGGPCISYELADNIDTSVWYCGEDIETLRYLKDIFGTKNYHISLSTDVRGVECAVALKNLYAVGVGLAIGQYERKQDPGKREYYNPQAALFGQSVREMGKILSLVGAKDKLPAFGIGDLYVTAFGGRSRLLGVLLGRGLTFKEAMEELEGQTLESVVIAQRTYDFLKTQIKKGKTCETDFPLLFHIHDLISNNKGADIPWKGLEYEA